MTSFVNFRAADSVTAPGWANMPASETWQESLFDDSTDQPNGWIIEWEIAPDVSAGLLGPETSGVGDAGWVVAGALRQGVRPFADGVWARARISGLNDSQRYNLGAIGSTNTDGREIRIRVVGTATSEIITLSNYDAANSKANDSEIALFTQIQPVEGEIFLEFSRLTSFAYINAAYIEEVESTDPSLTITNEAAITPGTTLTATASNFASAPTTISLSDGASPALTPTLTATASGDDYDLSALIADFKAQADAAGEGVAVQGLRTGTITATVE